MKKLIGKLNDTFRPEDKKGNRILDKQAVGRSALRWGPLLLAVLIFAGGVFALGSALSSTALDLPRADAAVEEREAMAEEAEASFDDTYLQAHQELMGVDATRIRADVEAAKSLFSGEVSELDYRVIGDHEYFAVAQLADGGYEAMRFTSSGAGDITGHTAWSVSGLIHSVTEEDEEDNEGAVENEHDEEEASPEG